MRTQILVGAAALALATTAFTAAKPVSLEKQVAKLSAVHEIQNLMTRYAQDNWNEQFDDLMQYIALDQPDVHLNVPNPLVGGGPVREAYEKRMASRAAGKGTPGTMHIHPNSSPFIEVAGDLKTAKGVFDSFAPDIGNGETPGTWVYSRYAVDFINEGGTWKIWHLQLFPVIGASSDKTLVQGAKDRAAMPAPANAKPTLLPIGGGKTVPLWRYNGTGDTPQNYPKLPQPYETFDPKDSY
jgi:hypothetical protein